MSARPRRRQPRVQYHAPLRITQAGEASAIDATALDLSQGGVGVRASGAYPVGSSVVCELDVQGMSLALPGVVAWAIEPPGPALHARRETQNLFRLGREAALAASHPASSPEPEGRPDTKTLIRLGAEPALDDAHATGADAEPAAMGICFETLLEDQIRLLGDLLREGTPASSRVELHFSGLADPIAARAEASSEGLLLRTGLPFLALDSEVRFRFAGEEEEQTGRVVRVELETQNRVPRLRVDIAERSAEERRERRRTPIPGPLEPSSGRTRAVFAGVLVGALLGVLGTLFALRDRDARAALLHEARVPALEASAVKVAAPSTSTRVEAANPQPHTAEPVLAEAVQDSHEAVAATAAAAAQDPTADPAPPITSAATSSTSAQPLPGPEPPAPEPPPEPEPAKLPVTVGAMAGEPEITTAGIETRVFVPMQGTDADISRYELSSPGLVVSLPHAYPSIPLADYAVYRGSVKRVWLRPFREGVQVRVVWRRVPLHSKVIWDERGLTLVFRG